MRDPFSWSFPIGRLFGITIKIHLLFPFVALGLILRAAYQDAAPEGAWIDGAFVVGLLFLSVLLHEFGHCFGARYVGGDSEEVLLWPLGGLASVDIPHTPRAHFWTAFAGPLVNLLLCAIALGLMFVLSDQGVRPKWNPFLGYTGRSEDGLLHLPTWNDSFAKVSPYSAIAVVSWLFYVNYVLLAFNMLLVGFPMDMGRMLQAILWPYTGYRQAMLTAVFVGFVTVFVVGVASIVMQETLAVFLAIFIYVCCKQEWMMLETGGEEGIFGYDFSQGYTSLEREDEPSKPAEPKLGWWARWRKRRADAKRQREEEQALADERRMDELLEKINQTGIDSLTDEERRFMTRVSDRYRNNRP